MAEVKRIASMRDVDAMVALDTFELITARVRKLLSYGRRISMTHRYTYESSRAPDLLVGLTLDTEARNGGITETVNEDSAFFSVMLKPGLTTGFGFSAYASDDNGTEAEAWRRYRAGASDAERRIGRRNMTMVTLSGGMDGDFGPARTDLIVVRDWNSAGVCVERVVGFDTEAYWAEQRAAEDAEVAR